MPPVITPMATAFGNALQAQFNALYGPIAFPDEVNKFTALTDAVTAVGAMGYDVEVYHGATSQVNFPPNPPFTRPAPQCELCDLAFVAFAGNEIRLSFMQVKDKKDGRPPFPLYMANTEQFDVLERRPPITAWLGAAVWPDDILNNAILASIGSFGVFHGSIAAANVDFHYSPADMLWVSAGPAAGGMYITSTLSLTAGSPPYRTNLGYEEVTQCTGIADFGRHYFLLEVGTPIHPYADAVSPISANGERATVNIRRSLARWIDAQLERGPVLDQLRQLLQIEAPAEPTVASLGVKKLVVLNGTPNE